MTTPLCRKLCSTRRISRFTSSSRACSESRTAGTEQAAMESRNTRASSILRVYRRVVAFPGKADDMADALSMRVGSFTGFSETMRSSSPLSRIGFRSRDDAYSTTYT